MIVNPEERIYLSVVTPDPIKALKELNRQNIILNSVEMIDALTVRFEIHSSDYYKLRKLAARKKWTLKMVHRSGLLWSFKKLIKRPILAASVIILLFLTLYLPSKVLFIQVEGNNLIPTTQVLDVASSGGIYFGAPRQKIRSEKVKNILLAQLPQLQWAGVNTHGCIAEISVQEKKEPEKMNALCGITSIVAARDGVIDRMHVSSGKPMCKPGDAVKAGEVLVSGYVDCGICVYGTTANGEIFAETLQNVSAKTLNRYDKKESALSGTKKYSLIIGKKRINLYKGSGISGATCGKMYEEHCLSLPGGFQLPLGVVEETWTEAADISNRQISEDNAISIMELFSKNYIEENMLAGKVIGSNQDFSRLEGADLLSTQFVCNEMIGRVRIEEMVNLYEEDN